MIKTYLKRLIKKNKQLFKTATAIDLSIKENTLYYIFQLKKPTKKNWKKIYLYEETQVAFGDMYKNLEFYVIQLELELQGLGNILFNVIEKLYRIEERYSGKKIPVIYIGSRLDLHLAEDEVGKINAWELYFEQPTYYGLLHVENARNVILGESGGVPSNNMHFGGYRFVHDEELIKQAQDIYKKYIHLSSRISKDLDRKYEKYFAPGKKILGVSYREWQAVAKEWALNGIDDPIWANSQYLRKRAEELFEEWQCDYILLATADKDEITYYSQKYGDKLIICERVRAEKNDWYLHGEQVSHEYFVNKMQTTEYLAGLGYLSEIYLMSRCSYLLASNNGLTRAALIMNEKGYAEKEIFDIGNWNYYNRKQREIIYQWFSCDSACPVSLYDTNELLIKVKELE